MHDCCHVMDKFMHQLLEENPLDEKPMASIGKRSPMHKRALTRFTSEEFPTCTISMWTGAGHLKLPCGVG